MRKTYAVRLALAALAVLFLMSSPQTVRAFPTFEVETWYYPCSNGTTLYPNGYSIAYCEGDYYSEGDTTAHEGDFKQVRTYNCNTGVTRVRWYYSCGGGWYLMSGPPSNAWCYC